VSVIFLSGPIGAGKTAVAKALSAQLPTSFLHRGRHILVLYSQRWGTRLAGQFSSAGTLDDSGGGSVCALWLPGLDRLLNTTHLHRDGTQDPEEVSFDFVLLRPSFEVCAKRAASRQEGAIRDYVMLKNFYARFEEGAIEPICDDTADPESLARLIVDGLNQGRFRVL